RAGGQGAAAGHAGRVDALLVVEADHLDLGGAGVAGLVQGAEDLEGGDDAVGAVQAAAGGGGVGGGAGGGAGAGGAGEPGQEVAVGVGVRLEAGLAHAAGEPAAGLLVRRRAGDAVDAAVGAAADAGQRGEVGEQPVRVDAEGGRRGRHGTS